MPAKSKAQVRKLFALQKRGEVKPGTAEEFVKATPGGYKALPQRVKPSARNRKLAAAYGGGR